jgi:hypothetical protein
MSIEQNVERVPVITGQGAAFQQVDMSLDGAESRWR